MTHNPPSPDKTPGCASRAPPPQRALSSCVRALAEACVQTRVCAAAQREATGCLLRARSRRQAPSRRVHASPWCVARRRRRRPRNTRSLLRYAAVAAAALPRAGAGSGSLGAACVRLWPPCCSLRSLPLRSPRATGRPWHWVPWPPPTAPAIGCVVLARRSYCARCARPAALPSTPHSRGARTTDVARRSCDADARTAPARCPA